MAEEVEKQQQQQPEETRKRKDDEGEGEGEEKKKEEGASSATPARKHQRTRREARGASGGAGAGVGNPADLLRLLAGVLGGGAEEQTSAQKRISDALKLLKAATKAEISLDTRAEVLRRTLAFVEGEKPGDWTDLDTRIAELRQAVTTAAAILRAGTPVDLAGVVKAAESEWPLGTIKFNTHRYSIKILRLMSQQKALQLVLANN